MAQPPQMRIYKGQGQGMPLKYRTVQSPLIQAALMWVGPATPHGGSGHLSPSCPVWPDLQRSMNNIVTVEEGISRMGHSAVQCCRGMHSIAVSLQLPWLSYHTDAKCQRTWHTDRSRCPVQLVVRHTDQNNSPGAVGVGWGEDMPALVLVRVLCMQERDVAEVAIHTWQLCDSCDQLPTTSRSDVMRTACLKVTCIIMMKSDSTGVPYVRVKCHKLQYHSDRV